MFEQRLEVRVRLSRPARKKACPAPAASKPVTGRIPRIARLMALALKLDRLVHKGVIKDYSELARLGHVTSARATQIMNLTLLAPDIQEALLFLPEFTKGRDPWPERKIMAMAAEPMWERQRELWRRLATGDIR